MGRVALRVKGGSHGFLVRQVITMPRYFFTARGPGVELPDREGEPLPDLEAARIAALETAREFAAHEGPDDWEMWAFHISDATGRTVLVVPFVEALPKH
jgi:hypothetical protein